MKTAPANGLTICYDTFGNAGDPALLLVMGLGAQMTQWAPEFCEALAQEGFHVVRFDNRDVGLSSKVEGGPAPDLAKAMAGDHSSASYTLWDMADDAAGLLDHLGVKRAHIVGASMGGMIVQCMAIRHPDRVASMTSIMSTTGDPAVGQASPEALGALLSPPPTSRDGAVEQMVKTFRVIGSPAYPADEEDLRRQAAADYDRCVNPEGTARQLLAIMATGDRTEALRGVTAPTFVIHGEADPLVNVSGGRATAAAIPGARLVTFPGVGHDIPRQLMREHVEVIVENTRRAG